MAYTETPQAPVTPDKTYHGCRNAPELWTQLEPNKVEALDRAERAARLTLPSLFMEQGRNSDKDATGRLWQSIGALLVNNIVTRLMMTLFSPSRPFIRLDASDELETNVKNSGVDTSVIRQALGLAERKTTRSLDKHALRPKLHLLLKHLVVVGNVLGIFDEGNKLIRALSLRYFCVKRDVAGRLLSTVIKECVYADELPEALRVLAGGEKEVHYYIVIHRSASTQKFEVSHWVNDACAEDMTRMWSEEDCPYRVLAWDVSDEANYGTSLVSDFEGDFLAAEDASKALIVAAVLASEFRWILDPASGMDVDEFEDVPNGGVIPGRPEHINLVNAAGEVAGAMKAQQAVLADVVNRLGRAFVMTSAVVRDSERTTAEEIRVLASELETGLGGGYSRLAVDLQLPLARFLMKLEKIDLKKYGVEDQIEVLVVTGLDALSRSGDLENLRAWLADIGQLNSAPESVTDPLILTAIYNDLASPRGIDATKYLRSEEEVAQRQQTRADQAAAARGVQTQQPEGPQQ